MALLLICRKHGVVVRCQRPLTKTQAALQEGIQCAADDILIMMIINNDDDDVSSDVL